uniref:CUB domain containing protein 1a n=1 Tax=Takifugu rubripes TaxID=31033 RepID=H2U5L0_TAKRU
VNSWDLNTLFSGVQALTLAPERGSTIRIRSRQVNGCKVCTGSGRTKLCNTYLEVNASLTVAFDCSRPEDVFNVEIVRNIGKRGHIVLADSGPLALARFNRRFSWNLKSAKAFEIDFSDGGLRQIKVTDRCPDGHSYTLQAFQATGGVVIGKYCRVGRIANVQILNQGDFSVDIPAGEKLQRAQFDVHLGDEIKSLARITLMLPKGTSSLELLSPNYPESFPDDDVMEWYFEVPNKHKVAVRLERLTEPVCLKKNTAVEYHNRARGAVVVGLAAPQPEQRQGNFTLTLRNCEMDRRRSGSSGLAVRLLVSSSSESFPGVSWNLQSVPKVSIHLKLYVNSVLKEEVTLTSKADVSFQDCLPEDVQITAETTIGKPTFQRLAAVFSCFPAPLSNMTWTVSPPRQATVELTSPQGYMRQSFPDQPCNDSVVINLEEDLGTIGQFCPQGAIQKIQIHHCNVTVTVSHTGGKNLSEHVMKTDSNEFKRYIVTVSPKRNTPVFLATPGWPSGMQDDSTISWIVSVPEKMEAHLMFFNLSQPKCHTRHTNIKVLQIGHREEVYSRREDEEAESEITVPGSFYLNMSNCRPERGHFSVITKITLQNNRLLSIVLSVVAVLLVIFIIVLIVVCVKKKKLSHQVSIYNPNGTSFLPGHNGFPETREDDDHVYTSIEDTLVYTHLLRQGKEIDIYGETDTYRPFTGRTEACKPPPAPSGNDQGLVDNVIYQTDGQSEVEHSPNLGPRLEPEGGN